MNKNGFYFNKLNSRHSQTGNWDEKRNKNSCTFFSSSNFQFISLFCIAYIVEKKKKLFQTQLFHYKWYQFNLSQLYVWFIYLFIFFLNVRYCLHSEHFPSHDILVWDCLWQFQHHFNNRTLYVISHPLYVFKFYAQSFSNCKIAYANPYYYYYYVFFFFCCCSCFVYKQLE